MPGKKISDLDVYDDINTDKSRKNLYEVSKNTGTYASPTYATNGSRKITQEQLRQELNIKEYLVRDFIVVGSGGTIVEDKVNAIIVTSNETFTLPTATSSNYGKSIVIANRCDYTVTINGIVNGTSIKLTNFNEVIQLSCLFDGVSTYGWWLVSDAINDKICTNKVVLNTNTYTAKHNDSIKADALSIGSDINITIPTAGIEGRLIYVYYPTGSPTAYVVNLIGGFSATLVQLDYFLIRDNGSYWEAISTSQNTATVEPAYNLSVPTGVCEGGILSINADPTKFNISDGFGYIADLYTDPDPANATITRVSWSGLTAQTVTNLATSTVTFVYINSAGSIVQTTIQPTEETLRDYIYIGQLGHSNFTSISNAISQPSVAQSPMSQLRDLWTELKYLNDGNIISANGANLSLNKSNGNLIGLGLNFENAIKTPNKKNFPAQTLATIRRRTQTGGTGTSTTLDVANYDLGGTVTTITGTKAQNQRVFLLTSGNLIVQYGQTLYNSLTEAVQGIETETFIELENVKTGQLIAIISVTSNCTSLQDTSRARIKNVGKFGEVNVGAGASSVSTLQQAYTNSTTPEILTDTTRGALSVKRGTASDTDTVFDVQNGAGTETFKVKGNGLVEITGALNYAPSVTIASAGTTDIGNANSNNIIISGTTTITSFGTCAEGIVRIIRFTGVLTLTHNATSLILPNGSNITTQVNDTAIFRSMGSGNWVCISYKSSTYDITTEVWSIDANYSVSNTTAKVLVIEQNGTLTASRTITLSNLPTGSIVVIRGGSSITATNVININSFVNGISSYSSALTLAYQSLILYSLGGGFYTTNKPQFTETTTALTTSKFLRSSSGIGLKSVSSFTPTWDTGVSQGDLNWNNTNLAILARDGSSNTIPFMPYASFGGWQNYRPTTLQYWNGQNIASGNKPTEYASALGFIYYWSRTYLVQCYGENDDNYLEVLIFVNSTGVPSIIRVLQESSVFSLTLSAGTLVFAGGNAYVNITQMPQRTTTNLRGSYNWVYQQGGTDVRYQGNLALGSSAINASAQLDLQSTSKGFLKNRLTSAQISSISTPAQGLEAFDTDLRNTVFLPVASGNPIRVSGTMFTQTANKQIQNTVTETSLVGTGVGSATIKANSSGIGTTYRLSMCGFISNTGAPFAQVKVKIGSVTVFDTTSTGMFGITGNQPFKVNAVFTVRTLGASGTVIGQGEFEYATSASTQYQIMFQANTATSTIDTTADQTVDITFTWGTANASNSINSTNFTLERL